MQFEVQPLHLTCSLHLDCYQVAKRSAVLQLECYVRRVAYVTSSVLSLHVTKRSGKRDKGGKRGKDAMQLKTD